MKKYLLWFTLLFTLIKVAKPQSWDESQDCHINVNDPNYLNSNRKPVIDATFRWSGCTGTLINRNTSDENLGFYFITARHCVSAESFEVNSPTIDFNVPYPLVFNYQSEGAADNSTWTTNMGESGGQSNLYPTPPANVLPDAHEYHHTSQLRLVNRFFWGDFALCEILTPLPPHFNVTYSGWNPSRFFNGFQVGSGGGLPGGLPSKFVGVSHPEGDIKKLWGSNAVLWLETAEASGCYGVTTLIDILFGWMWGHNVSTQVICNYVDNPWLMVPALSYGATENGSSGSGIFNAGNKHLGILSTGPECDFPGMLMYGKLHANYPNQSIKNTLNPSNEIGVDLMGMSDRKIDCYQNLTLPGATGVSGQYFPASHYQSVNKIFLRAQHHIETTQPINVYPSADYTLRAGESITINPGLNTALGANFVAEIKSCYERSSKNDIDANEQLIQRLKQINLPKRKVFEKLEPNSLKYLQSFLNLYPNPANETCQVDFNFPESKSVTITLLNLLGSEVALAESFYAAAGNSTFKFNTSNYASGIYFVRINDGSNSVTKKLVIEH